MKRMHGECLELLARSGLEFRDWTRRNRIDGRSLHAWKLALQKRKPKVQLVELVTEASTASDDDAARRSSPLAPARYIVRVQEIEIKVGDNFNQATLSRLLDVVAPW